MVVTARKNGSGISAPVSVWLDLICSADRSGETQPVDDKQGIGLCESTRFVIPRREATWESPVIKMQRTIDRGDCHGPKGPRNDSSNEPGEPNGVTNIDRLPGAHCPQPLAAVRRADASDQSGELQPIEIRLGIDAYCPRPLAAYLVPKMRSPASPRPGMM